MIRAWLQAARPLSQANIAVPLLFGQALAYSSFHAFSWRRLLWVHAFGILAQLFIVFANDVADRDADRLNREPTPFSGGSRVLVDGKITPRDLAYAALATALGLGLLGLSLTLVERLPFALLLATCPLFLLWAYSFPPLRLSYRGGGEHLQALGVGVVLPVVGYYFQTSTFAGLPWVALAPSYVLGWAGNVITAIPDEAADRRVDKSTVPVRLGANTARFVVLAALALGLAGTPWATPEATQLARAASVLPAAAALLVAGLNLRGDGRDSIPFVAAAGSAGLLAQIGWSAAAWLA
ncbi:MAG: prenyltransferase [Polyangiaceae bacterium]